jgi:NADPH-ferrihemoprotein reductase
MAQSSSSDVIILALGVALAALYLFRDQIFSASKPSTVPTTASKVSNGDEGNPRDFVAKMKAGVSTLCFNNQFIH